MASEREAPQVLREIRIIQQAAIHGCATTQPIARRPRRRQLLSESLEDLFPPVPPKEDAGLRLLLPPPPIAAVHQARIPVAGGREAAGPG